MSIDSISGGNPAAINPFQNQPGPRGKMGKDFSALAKALSSGDINAAKTAFATIQSDFKSNQGKANDGDGDDQNSSSTLAATSANSSNSNNPMAALASALSSGDLSGAQQAFSQLQKGHHHHRHGGGEGSESSNSQAGSAEETSAANSVSSTSFEALISMTTTTTSSAAASAAAGLSSALGASDPFGLSGQKLDIQA